MHQLADGDSYDNALAAVINRLHKEEVIRKDGSYLSLNDVELATLSCLELFNNRRLLSPISELPAAEFEVMHHQQTELGNFARPR